MLRAALQSLLHRGEDEEPSHERQAYHSDIRAIRPDVWTTATPTARGCEVEQAMWLAGVSSRDFAEVVDIALSPDLVTPVDDIVELCLKQAASCRDRACALSTRLPPPNPFGRPPLPWHRGLADEAQALRNAARSWEALGDLLVNNRWHP